MSNFCLIGDVLVDVSLKSKDHDIKLRFGGIMHAARCLWAMNIPFSVGYFAPTYLDAQIKDYLASLDCTDVTKLGDVIGSPYICLIKEVKEVSDQGYEFLLRDEISYLYNDESLRSFLKRTFDGTLIIAGNFDLKKVLSPNQTAVSIDLANHPLEIDVLSSLGKKFETIFLSTSSEIFKQHFKSTFQSFATLFEQTSEQLVLKENRGGSRCYNFDKHEIVQCPAQTRPIVHSVGVGDSYDAVFMVSGKHKDIFKQMTLASWIAAEYACTTYPDDFKLGVQRVLRSPLEELVGLKGVALSWESRKNICVYIAGPDFDFMDATAIDQVEAALLYHNFNPIRPIKKFGQMEVDATKARRQELFANDIEALEGCSILIAVIISDDPGTMIELGLASAKGIKTLVYDPFGQANNCMLTELPYLLSSDLDEIIAEVFVISSNLPLK